MGKETNKCKNCGENIMVNPNNGLCIKCEKENSEKKLGMKFDDEKLKYSLIPVVGLREEAKVLNVNIEKYAVNNWQKVPDGFNRYCEAIYRHILEIMEAVNNGKDPMSLKDKDDGLHPLAHIACDAHFALWFADQENKLDDEIWKEAKKNLREKYKKEREDFLKDKK